jgi:hypothetical protein
MVPVVVLELLCADRCIGLDEEFLGVAMVVPLGEVGEFER